MSFSQGWGQGGGDTFCFIHVEFEIPLQKKVKMFNNQDIGYVIQNGNPDFWLTFPQVESKPEEKHKFNRMHKLRK